MKTFKLFLAAVAICTATAMNAQTPATTKQAQKTEMKKEKKSGDAGMVKAEKREMKAAEHKEEKAAGKATKAAPATEKKKAAPAKKASAAGTKK